MVTVGQYLASTFAVIDTSRESLVLSTAHVATDILIVATICCNLMGLFLHADLLRVSEGFGWGHITAMIVQSPLIGDLQRGFLVCMIDFRAELARL